MATKKSSTTAKKKTSSRAAKSAASSARRKTAGRKTAGRKAAGRKAAGRKPASRKAASKKPGSGDVSPVTGQPVRAMDTTEADIYRRLIVMRDQIMDGISFLAGDSLNRSQRDSSGDLSGYSIHMADVGTDNFDREFALTLATSERQTLRELEEAIRKLEAGDYGICEMCSDKIPVARLRALPYARYCVRCKEEVEKRIRLGLPAVPVGAEDADESPGDENASSSGDED